MSLRSEAAKDSWQFVLVLESENPISWKQNWKEMTKKRILMGYIKMEHETSWIKNSMKERHNEKSCPVHIEESYQ